jgi:glycosyltransferase involved in cell wall biosynthesis
VDAERRGQADSIGAAAGMTERALSSVNTPLVSVLLTSYNREAFIAEAIESVLAQTLTDFELIICDDQSRDRTRDIVDEYARRDPRIRASVNQRNLGDYPNRNKAASLARGRFLKYHDSDDVMYRHCLAVMVEALDAEPRAGFALSGSRDWPGGRCPMLLTPRLAYEREFLGAGLFHVGPSCALFRTEVLRRLGGFPEAGVASDYLFWIHTCASENVLLVPGDLFYYRVHSNQEYANPGNVVHYARARGAAWKMLGSLECPLDPALLDRAKSNFVWATTRDAYRAFNAGKISSAAAIVRFSGLGVVDWLRYLRRPNRKADAGTPAES